MLFDTHTHLCETKYDNDRTQILESLTANNVGRIIEVGDDLPSSIAAKKLAESYPFVYCSLGVHPYCVRELKDEDMNFLENLYKQAPHPEKILAIGEIGLDYHANHHEYKDAQKIWFEKQINLAKKLNLPIIVHVRDAYDDCLEILRKTGIKSGIIHCFSGDKDFAKTVCDMGFYIAFGGAMTYSNADNIKEAAKTAPIDKILLETDCPYLVPKGAKVSRNEPKYVAKVAELLATLRNVSVEEIENITYNNACNLFKLTPIA